MTSTAEGNGLFGFAEEIVLGLVRSGGTRDKDEVMVEIFAEGIVAEMVNGDVVAGWEFDVEFGGKVTNAVRDGGR